MLGVPTSPNAWPLTLIVAAGIAGAVAIFAGVPIVAGLWRIGAGWRARGKPVIEAADRTFLLVAMSFAASLAMVLLFSFRATYFDSEILRIWGRYFEFFAPLAWLAAAPAIVQLDAEARRPWRIAACGLVLAGLAALLFAFHKGVVLFPWDSTALTAFYRPDAARFALPTTFPVPGRRGGGDGGDGDAPADADLGPARLAGRLPGAGSAVHGPPTSSGWTPAGPGATRC